MVRVPLDADQAAAASHGDGPCMVLAGPGSGKTRVIVERFLALLEAGVPAAQILVLTYTNKAAAEMRERVESAVSGLVGDSPLTTYHAFCNRVLREWGWLIGVSPTFRIADDAELWLHMEAVLDEVRPTTLWNPLRPHDMIDPLLKLVGSAKQELVTPDDYAGWVAERRRSSPGSSDLDSAQLDLDAEAAAVYAALQTRYARSGVLDFDDTILYTERLLRDHASARHAVSGGVRYIMVDEYQDTNYAQARLVERLAEQHHNVMVVADDDQAIYKFRGASQANLDRFAHTYPDHVRVVLGTNYRSTAPIVEAAAAIIAAANPDTRLDKQTAAERGSGAAIEIWEAPDWTSEAEAVAAECAALIAAGSAPTDLAWLFRRHADIAAAMTALDRRGIAYTVHGGRGYFRQKEVKDLLAMLTAISEPRNSQALLRCLLMPAWQVSARGRVALIKALGDHDADLLDLLDGATAIEGLDAADLAAAQQCAAQILELHAESEREDVRDLFYEVMDRSAYLSLTELADDTAARQLGANLNKFGELLDGFADWSDDRRIATALHYLNVLRDARAADEIPTVEVVTWGVSLLTAHSAKGLEWPVVFLGNCVEKRWPGFAGFPDRLRLPDELVPEPPPPGDSHVDEERRLFYVAATRARDRLIFTMARRYPDTFAGKAETATRFLSSIAEQTGTLHVVLPSTTTPPARRRRNLAADGTAARLKLSVSDLGAFRDCPRQFAYRKRYHMPVRTGIAAWYGTLIHEVLQIAATRRRGGDEVNTDQVVALWHDLWQAKPGPKGSHADLRTVGVQQLQRYLESAAWLNADIEGVESSFTMATDHADVVGRFDRIDRRDGAAVIVDYKTGPPRTAEALGRDMQARAYAAAASRINDSKAATVEFHYLQTGDVVAAEFSPASLDTAFWQIGKVTAEVAAAWSTGDFPAKPSAWRCQRCDYRTVCDEGQQAVRQDPVTAAKISAEATSPN